MSPTVITGIVLLTVAAGLFLVALFRFTLPMVRVTMLANAGLLVGAAALAFAGA